MPMRLLLLASLVVAAGCTRSTVVPKSSGSIAVSNDDALLFVADADHDMVTVIDTKTQRVVRQVQVGHQPERVLVSPSGDVYVSNRGSRSVSRLSPNGEAVLATATVGAEPVGLAISADGKQLLVANSMSGTISRLDATTLASHGEVQVGGRPWAIAPAPDQRRLYVTDFAAGTVRVVEPASGLISTLTLEQPTQVECAFGEIPSRTPAQAADVVISPDGDRVYVAHVQSRTGTDRGMQASLRLAVAPAMSTIETSSDTVRQDVARTRNGLTGDTTSPTSAAFPPALLSTNLDEGCRVVGGSTGMDAPSSLVVDGMGEWVFVADHNSNAVAVVSSTRRSEPNFRVPNRGIADVVRVGARPTGIAISGDLKHAYVHNALDYTVSFIENRDGRLVETKVVGFDHSPLPAAAERGRRLFYSAVDERVTQPEFGGVSCSSCHPDGRADGLSWVLPTGNTVTDPWNPWPAAQSAPARNTPALWGVAATAPYHWDGALTDMPAFSHRMVNQMGGGGISSRDIGDLTAYMETIQQPDNPALGSLAPGLVARGQELFAQRCESCHAGANLTDGLSHPTSVGSLDTPSLKGVFATGPYLHDGSVKTLREVFTTSRPTVVSHDQRGLSAADLDALDAFVSTR